MTRQIIFTGTTANDGTGDTLRDGAAKINANFQEIYETFGPDGLVIGTQVNFDSASINFRDVTLTYETNLSAVGPSQNQFIRLPDYSAFVVLDSATQTITNKTLDSCSYGALLINDLSSTHHYQVLSSELASNITVRLPVLSDSDTFVFANATQSISGKTLDSDTINNAIIPDGTWRDANNNEILGFNAQGSAVNYLLIRNSATNSPVDLQVVGDDTNVDLNFLPQGAGHVMFETNVTFGDGQTSDIVNITGGTNLLGNVAQNRAVIFLNYGSAGTTWGLADGSKVGQILYVGNKNAQAQTVQPTSFATTGTSFTLDENEIAHLMWSANGWHLINATGGITVT